MRLKQNDQDIVGQRTWMRLKQNDQDIVGQRTGMRLKLNDQDIGEERRMERGMGSASGEERGFCCF